MTDHVITQKRCVDAPAERVFDAFTQPEEQVVWFTTNAEADVTPGGRYRNGDGDEGKFLVVEPPHRVTFTWDNPDHCPGTVVDVRFESQGTGRTVVRLTHRDLTTKDHWVDLNRGWSWAMDSLKAYLETGRPIAYEAWVPEDDS